MIEHLLLLACVALTSAPQPQGRRIVVKEGDTLVVDSRVNARIVRSRSGEVRFAASDDGMELALMIDESTGEEPDGLVDRVYRFQLQQPFPADLLWRGFATLEEIDEIKDGDLQRRMGPTVITPNVRIRFDAASEDRDGAVMIRTRSAQARQLTNFYTGGRTFDEVEHIWLHHLEDSVSQFRTSVGMSAQPPTGGVVIRKEAPDATADRAGTADRGIPRAEAMRGDSRFTPPRVLSELRPGYSADAMRRGVQGRVMLDVTVGSDGSVTDVKVTQSLDPDLDKSAMEAASRWRFQPGMKDGAPVPVVVTIEMTFTLKK